MISLSRYPKALALLEQAKLKYDAKVFQRSLIDDLRLGLVAIAVA